MQIFKWSELGQSERNAALARPAASADQAVISAVSDIAAQVKSGRDAALLALTEKFDGVRPAALRVPQTELERALDSLPAEQRAALERAKSNIERFHTAQTPANISIETESGLDCQRLARPLASVGLYIPGGTAPLVSTVLMLALPARIAGVKRRVLVTPPQRDGSINSATLAAAQLCGVTEVYCVGGAQAIAALAFGTETISPVAKIFGPGNKYVAAAKSYVSALPGGPAMDLPAGPSEAMVVADQTANPAFAAADLLSQAEHDVDAQVIGIFDSEATAEAVKSAISAQLQTLNRKDIARQSLANARLFIAQDRGDVLDIINCYAPEHLLLQCVNAEDLIGDIDNAGSIFVGNYTPESLGDYASGTNHTLPTSGAARAYSGVTLDSFYKYISVQKASKAAIKSIGPSVEILARMEGLDAHERAVTLRLQEAENG